eukprot:TRINITY_DN52285_c0_g1_i1.p1 TRINITY_DN52285_c0_g1~~TRINITY_DN52285_c0_g1_i1.p1  ORF type:complete len:498 (+),score=108.84 TRINITY_DN52285_c0_g1_i1:69-1562(+)
MMRQMSPGRFLRQLSGASSGASAMAVAELIDESPRRYADLDVNASVANRVASALETPLLPVPPRCGALRSGWRFELQELQQSLAGTAEATFLHSDINGRQSRRIVLLGFWVSDVLGAVLWALWCEAYIGTPETEYPRTAESACWSPLQSFGVNRFVWCAACLPLEGAILFTAGKNPFAIWSDVLLLPVWLLRLLMFDVVLWHVDPPTLLGDALWFCVMAVMCRVHSLALAILVVLQIVCIAWVLELRRAQNQVSFLDVRFGVYSFVILSIMAVAYFLDEQSRLQSVGELMTLQDRNARLADRLLRWKVLPESPQLGIKRAPVAPVPELGSGLGRLAKGSSDMDFSLGSSPRTRHSNSESALPVSQQRSYGASRDLSSQLQQAASGAVAAAALPEASSTDSSTSKGGSINANKAKGNSNGSASGKAYRSVKFVLPKEMPGPRGVLVPTRRPATDRAAASCQAGQGSFGFRNGSGAAASSGIYGGQPTVRAMDLLEAME